MVEHHDDPPYWVWSIEIYVYIYVCVCVCVCVCVGMRRWWGLISEPICFTVWHCCNLSVEKSNWESKIEVVFLPHHLCHTIDHICHIIFATPYLPYIFGHTIRCWQVAAWAFAWYHTISYTYFTIPHPTIPYWSGTKRELECYNQSKPQLRPCWLR